MKNMQNYEGISYYPKVSQEYVYYYFPVHPLPQTDSNGDPMISIVGGGANWFLQASTKWGAPAEKVSELAKRLTEQGLIRSPMDLRPAPLKVKRAELVLQQEDGEKVLATSGSSGQYPFMAIFNTGLTEEMQHEVVAAFHGRKDALIVRYHATLELEHIVAMSLSGPVHMAGQQLNERSSTEDIAVWLEVQIKKGAIKVQYEIGETAPAQLQQRANKKIREEAVAEIQRFLRPVEIPRMNRSLT